MLLAIVANYTIDSTVGYPSDSLACVTFVIGHVTIRFPVGHFVLVVLYLEPSLYL